MREVKATEIKENAIKLIGKDWALITAGDESGYNTMTASWGGLGQLWNKDVCFIFIRPQRYTYEFIEKNELFTMSFYPEEYRKALSFCGTKSGRDYDKAKETGLVPVFTDGTTSFEEAKLTLVCRKLAFQDMSPDGFLDESIKDNYALGDYHRIYVGEIVKAYEQS